MEICLAAALLAAFSCFHTGFMFTVRIRLLFKLKSEEKPLGAAAAFKHQAGAAEPSSQRIKRVKPVPSASTRLAAINEPYQGVLPAELRWKGCWFDSSPPSLCLNFCLRFSKTPL